VVKLDVNAVLGALASLVAVIAGIVAALVWFRRWVRSQVAAPVQAAAKQLQTSNGTTVAGYVEQLAKDVAGLKDAYAATDERSIKALAVAEHTSERLDDHLRIHGAVAAAGVAPLPPTPHGRP
jgi:hypothetical protein